MLTLCIIAVLTVGSAFSSKANERREPMYKYRYQTDEMMKTSASEVPVRGYHIAEGSYFPEYAGQDNRFSRYTDVGPGGYRDFGFHPYMYGAPYVTGPVGFHGPSGGFVDRNFYRGENRNVEGGTSEKAHGSKGESSDRGSEGYSRGQIAHKDAKEDSGSYKDEEGAKKSYDDGRSYQGGQQFNKAGQNGEAQKQKSNHRKGHTKKGFKTFHHKDESGNTETFYDEANDEGDNYNYDGNQGSFAANEKSSFKGGHENGQFATDERRKQGRYDNQHAVDNANGDKGQYGQRGHQGSGEVYNYNNGIGQHSLLERQEANRDYYKRFPHGYVPFYAGY